MSLCDLRVERCGHPFDPTLLLTGELDSAAVGAVDAVLASEVAAADGDINLDLSKLVFIGSAGVDMLIALSRRLAADRGRRLRIAGPNPFVDRVLHVVGVELTLTTTGDRFVPTRRTSRIPSACELSLRKLHAPLFALPHPTEGSP